MKKWISFLFVLLVGCSTPKQPSVGMGDVPVPKMYHPSLGGLDKPPSQYERYLEMFREGYWNCIMRYIEDIDYIPKESDRYANGWMSEIDGYDKGYRAAEKDMDRNIKRFGKEHTKKYLKEVADGGGL